MFTFKQLGNYGRFGNQLFQIASTIGIATRNASRYCFPEWEYSKYFLGKLPEFENRGYTDYNEGYPYYRDIDLKGSTDWNLVGYFQSWKYFDYCQDEIRDLFRFEKGKVDGVAIHVRRGDYLRLSTIHPVLDMNYYNSAMEYFKGERFTVYSDDIGWCKQNFQDVEFYDTTSDSILDFQHMASHNKFIIANSSYSWWAAYLSHSRDVIAPKIYVHGEAQDDRVPPDWIRL